MSGGKSLGRLAFERYSTLLAIGEQIGRGGKIQVGAEPWDRLPARERHVWETFAKGFAREIVFVYEEAKRTAEAEKERKAMRADVYEQEVRRRVAEEIGRK